MKIIKILSVILIIVLGACTTNIPISNNDNVLGLWKCPSSSLQNIELLIETNNNICSGKIVYAPVKMQLKGWNKNDVRVINITKLNANIYQANFIHKQVNSFGEVVFEEKERIKIRFTNNTILFIFKNKSDNLSWVKL